MAEKTAPLLEDALKSALSGDTLQTALDLVAHLRENGINPLWSATNAWKISYKSFSVCFIRVHGAADYYGIEANCWKINPFIGDYDGDLLPVELKEIVWAHKRTCPACGKCALVLDTVFGKKYDYACEKAIVFTNPGASEAECVKKLIELRKAAIKAGNAKKHKYIPVKDRK